MGKRLALVAGAVALLAAAAAVPFASAGREGAVGAVYTLSNSPTGNAVLAFDRAADGSLSSQGSYPTGGLGTGAGLGSQGAVVVSDDGRRLFTVNAGSDSISEFAIDRGGLTLLTTVPSGGRVPISIAQRGHLLYVLNAGGSGNIAGFLFFGDRIVPLPGSTQPLGAGSSGPAQIAFAPTGRELVVTEKTSRTIDTYRVDLHGRARTPIVSASAGATPFGFDFDLRGHLLVSEAAGSASSYAVDGSGAHVISGAVATHQGAPCWLVTSKDGRFAYTANAGSGTLSGFTVGRDGSLALLDATGVTADLGAGSHPLDEAASADGRFLYNLTDGRHELSALRIGSDGRLTAAGSIGGLPAGAAGLVAR
jgi:6-phosphogluconolactonase (cycloisomerase 2 family)